MVPAPSEKGKTKGKKNPEIKKQRHRLEAGHARIHNNNPARCRMYKQPGRPNPAYIYGAPQAPATSHTTRCLFPGIHFFFSSFNVSHEKHHQKQRHSCHNGHQTGHMAGSKTVGDPGTLPLDVLEVRLSCLHRLAHSLARPGRLEDR